jgi:hypothetical protein
MRKVELRIERLPTGAYFVWHDWWKSAPIAGPMNPGQMATLPDGRMVLRQGKRTVKWYIPPGWWEAPRALSVASRDATTPTGGKDGAGH